MRWRKLTILNKEIPQSQLRMNKWGHLPIVEDVRDRRHPRAKRKLEKQKILKILKIKVPLKKQIISHYHLRKKEEIRIDLHPKKILILLISSKAPNKLLHQLVRKQVFHKTFWRVLKNCKMDKQSIRYGKHQQLFFKLLKNRFKIDRQKNR